MIKVRANKKKIKSQKYPSKLLKMQTQCTQQFAAPNTIKLLFENNPPPFNNKMPTKLFIYQKISRQNQSPHNSHFRIAVKA